MSEPAIVVRDVTKSFGGVRAVSDASFELEPGRLTALIGPNGAGKTTLFNVITNFYPADAGTISLFGQNPQTMTPWELADFGVIRTFQTARVFPGMTTFENLLTGAHLHFRGGLLGQMLGLPQTRAEEKRVSDKAMLLLDLIGMAQFRDDAAADLPMGAQKLLEVARALMAGPRLLLLDEPAAGLNDAETAELAALLRAVRESGVTLLVVEHNMSFVMGSADHVIVLDAGVIVARGDPAEIQQNARVIEAYVGRLEETN
jgi:branched-chain amino acid transport system ATP-binding protein